MAQLPKAVPFDPNDGAQVGGARLPSLEDVQSAATDLTTYCASYEGIVNVKAGSAIMEAAKALVQAPNALQFTRASMMPDPEASGVIPVPGLAPGSIQKIVQENVAPQMIIGMRVDDVLRYSEHSTHAWRPGWRFELFQGDRAPDKQNKKDMREAEQFLYNSNVETSYSDAIKRDKNYLKGFKGFLAMSTRDSLTFDIMAIWTRRDQKGRVIEYTLLPGSNIRLVDPTIGYLGDKSVYAVAVDEAGGVATNRATAKPMTFTREELVVYVRNPRVDYYASGYGYPECEIAIRLIMGFQQALDLNINTFDRNAIPNGILMLTGSWVQKQVDVLSRLWGNLMRGVTKRWALPAIAVPSEGKIEVLNLQDLKGTDVRYQDLMNMVIGGMCTVWRFPVRRLGYRISGRGPDTSPWPDASTKIVDEDDPGLAPLLGHIATVINEYLIWPRWPDLRFVFTGASPKEDARQYEARQNAMTYKERRAQSDLPSNEEILPPGSSEAEKKLARIMDMAPTDANLSGIYQTAVSAMLQAEAQTTKDGDQPGNRMTSRVDPARSEAHGATSGVRRDSKAETESAASATQ